jgi:hypothetical protein
MRKLKENWNMKCIEYLQNVTSQSYTFHAKDNHWSKFELGMKFKIGNSDPISLGQTLIQDGCNFE